MYEQVKTVIKGKRFELKDMLRKIDVLWMQGSLTDEQKEELVNLARNDADMSKGYASTEQRLEALEAFRAEIEAWKKQIEQSDEMPDAGGTEEDAEYPPWKQPTDATNAYYNGMKMTYTDNKKYECIAPEGYGVTYGPDVLPNMWKLVEG